MIAVIIAPLYSNRCTILMTSLASWSGWQCSAARGTASSGRTLGKQPSEYSVECCYVAGPSDVNKGWVIFLSVIDSSFLHYYLHLLMNLQMLSVWACPALFSAWPDDIILILIVRRYDNLTNFTISLRLVFFNVCGLHHKQLKWDVHRTVHSMLSYPTRDLVFEATAACCRLHNVLIFQHFITVICAHRLAIVYGRWMQAWCNENCIMHI